MAEPIDELIPTRATLIQRLKNWQDEASWQDFFRRALAKSPLERYASARQMREALRALPEVSLAGARA